MTTATETSKYGLQTGSPAIRSVGTIAFGPDGVLFIADNVSAVIFAIDTQDGDTAAEAQPLNIEQLDSRLASYLGCAREEVLIRGMAAHPVSQNIYLSVMRGSGAAAVPVIAKICADGTITDVTLRDLPFAQTAIEDAPADDDERRDWRRVLGNREGELQTRRDGVQALINMDPFRTITVTDMQYIPRRQDRVVLGQLLVAGASNEEFSSVFRKIPFPFGRAAQRAEVEIFHVNHSQYETISPIRTFVPYGDGSRIVASYTCTPLVSFQLDDLRHGTQAIGKTVGELGGWSTPVDMVTYERDGREYLLVANSGLPLMKIATADIDEQPALRQPREPLGVSREALPLEGVGQMATLSGEYVAMLQHDAEGNVSLRSRPTSSL